MGLINEWTLNNTLEDSVQCNDLTIYTGASFIMESTNPPLYSGYVPSTGYFQAPNDVYFSGDLTITAYVLVKSIRKWSRVLDFANPVLSMCLRISFGRRTILYYIATMLIMSWPMRNLEMFASLIGI